MSTNLPDSTRPRTWWLLIIMVVISSTISPPCLSNSGKFCLCISFYIHSRLVSRVTKSFWNFCSTEVVAWVAVVRNLISLNLHTPVSGPSVTGALPNMATHISATEIVTKVQTSLAVPLVSKRYWSAFFLTSWSSLLRTICFTFSFDTKFELLSQFLRGVYLPKWLFWLTSLNTRFYTWESFLYYFRIELGVVTVCLFEFRFPSCTAIWVLPFTVISFPRVVTRGTCILF